MKNPQIILVTGATGAVGPRIVEALRASGYRVRTLSIDPPPVNAWLSDVEVCNGDVTDSQAVRDAMQEVESVIHLAALLHIVNPPPALKEKYERINVGGTKTVVESAIQSGVRRVVLFSTISVYGQSQGRILTEDTPPAPNTFYARTKLAAERIVLEAKGADNKQLGTVLRFGAVYGGRIKGNYKQLLRSLARGRFVPIGNGKNRRTLIYDKDVALAAVLAARHPDAAGHIYNVSDGRFHMMNEIIAAMCGALGKKPPHLSLPIGPVRFAAGLLEDGARFAGLRSPLGRASIDKYTEDIAVDAGRIQAQLGFVPRYDLAEGWHETVKEMRKIGYL